MDRGQVFRTNVMPIPLCVVLLLVSGSGTNEVTTPSLDESVETDTFSPDRPV